MAESCPQFDGKRIIRVFPRKTSATPDDLLSIVNRNPCILDYADEVHISVVFSWDLPLAEKLAKKWESVAPVSIGGPATGHHSEEFVPGKYVKSGHTITSRGCPNKCWFCSVWRREGAGIRELSIQEGHIIQDDNLLACSEKHIKDVFLMLKNQSDPIKFAGGLEAKILKDWHLQEFLSLGNKLSSAMFAYDTSDDLEPLQVAGKMLVESGLMTKTNNIFRCYILVGYPKDTFGKAEKRVHQVMKAGFIPYIMIYRGEDGTVNFGWKEFKNRWHRLASIMLSICLERRKHLF